jgi:large subunit ribosomal protein L20
MTRIAGGWRLRHRHKKKLKLTKGYRGAPSILYRPANQQLIKALQNGFVSRRLRKRDFRKIWIARINGQVRQYGLNYHKFIDSQNTVLNRKIWAQLALYDSEAFIQKIQKI